MLHHSAASPGLPHGEHFGFLLVDEAAQASEAELCIPLSVLAPAPMGGSAGISPSYDYDATALPHVTICGDMKQLGPRIESEECRNLDMDVSLLERLFDLEVYRNSPFSRKALKLRRGKSSNEKQVTQKITTPFCNLTKNYRSHPAILMLPSTIVRVEDAFR